MREPLYNEDQIRTIMPKERQSLHKEGDSISREYVLEELNAKYKFNRFKAHNDAANEGISQAEDIVENAPSVIVPKPYFSQLKTWIPCSTALPAPETEVLVSFSDGTVKTVWQKWAESEGGNYPGEPLAYIMDGCFPETEEEWEKYKVYAVAWMSLPKAYSTDNMTDNERKEEPK